MTIKEFLELLEPGDWRLEGVCLMDENDSCPVWHVYDHHYGGFDDGDEEWPDDYCEAGRRAGLRTRDAIAIGSAADGRGHSRLRKRLLSAVGVAE